MWQNIDKKGLLNMNISKLKYLKVLINLKKIILHKLCILNNNIYYYYYLF